MARWSRPSRRRLHWSTAGVLGLALAAAVAGCSSPQASTGPGGGDASADRLLVCESGTVTHGDVRTSSAVASRVPEGTEIPPGCRLA
ncbi:MAG TPA: hypothetical protein VIH82_04930 [Acidimicrobiia bacterium]|jgi:hypothetical protein